MTNGSGTATLARNFEPYGTTLTSSSLGSANTVWQFTGEARDGATNLTFLRARYYASAIGRFVSQDSWAGDGGRPLSLNGWNYSEGDPINHTDPSGKNPIPICAALILAGGGPEDPIGDALCVIVIGATAYLTWFYATTPPPNAFSQSQVILPQHTGNSPYQINIPVYTIPPANNPQLPQHTGGTSLLSLQIPCYTSPFPLYPGLNVPQHTPGPLDLSKDLQLPTFYTATLEWDSSKPLVYGPTAGGKLANFANQIGGQTLTDFGNPKALDIVKLSIGILLTAAQSRRRVVFDLTNIKDITGVLAGTGDYTDKVTSKELRYIRENWDVFEPIVTFYKDGEYMEGPPW